MSRTASRAARAILDSSRFKQARRSLLAWAASQTLPAGIAADSERPSGGAVQELVLLASALSLAPEDDPREAAAEVAISVLRSDSLLPEHRAAAAQVLRRLANVPAIQLATERGLIPEDLESSLPLPLWREARLHRLQDRVSHRDGRDFSVNRFQRNLWSALKEHGWVSLSAPTSAGKSYVLERWIAEVILKPGVVVDVVYVVPTRALITQVENDLMTLLAVQEDARASILTMPSMVGPAGEHSRVFVMTQERVHRVLQTERASLSPGLVVVDEAQKMGDGQRGILLQQVVDQLVAVNPACQVVFASALSSNPEALLADAPDVDDAVPVVAREPNVLQSLFWVSQVPRRPKVWAIQHVVDGEPSPVGRVYYSYKPGTLKKKMAFAAFHLEQRGGAIVYSNGAKEAEEVATLIADMVREQRDERPFEDPELDGLVELIETAVHKGYQLASVVKWGVGFHYGNIPTIVRKEVERLFGLGSIRYLVCTSTLLEGVNLPCRSLFARNPRRGQGNPMSPADFWNLAGRAGRWGREFTGNIFCIDANRPEAWPLGVPSKRATYRLSIAAQTALSSPDAFVKYVEEGAQSGAKDEALARFEYLCSYLAGVHIEGRSIRSLRWLAPLGDEQVRAIARTVEAMIGELSVPDHVVVANAGISPVAIDALYRYLYQRVEFAERLLPPPPESANAAGELANVFEVLNLHFGGVFGGDRRRYAIAVPVVGWMRGFTVARIIEERLRYFRRQARDYELGNQIRLTMSMIDEFARFKAPKYLGCYVDVLREVFLVSGREDLTEDLPDFGELLEFGVAQRTQLSLIALGMSRTAAVTIAALIASDELSVEEALRRLETTPWEGAGLAPAFLREIGQAVERGRLMADMIEPQRLP